MMDALQRTSAQAANMYLSGNGYWMTTGIGADGVHQGPPRPQARGPGLGRRDRARVDRQLGGLWRLGSPNPSSAARRPGLRWRSRLSALQLRPRVESFFGGARQLIPVASGSSCGAVGDEVDRMDRALGTPPHALHLATSQTLPDDTSSWSRRSKHDAGVRQHEL
jgi:hypothetical protein